MLQQYKTILRSILTPGDIVDGVEDIRPEELYKKGYRTLLLDVDNTLMTDEQREMSLQKVHWVEMAKTIGFEIYLVSNNSSRRRIERVCRQLQVKGVYFALKPFPFATRDLVERHQIELRRCVVIGDQLLKDVILGNWLEIHSILVNPLDIGKSFIKTLQRDIELWILDCLDDDL